MTDPTTTNQPDPRDPLLDRTLDEEDREPDVTERTSERDPERASAFATRGDPSTTTTDVPDGTQRAGVRWVRPTDLAAQAGAAVLARGAEANRQLHDAVADGLRELRANLADRLARRQAQLEPETTTGPATQERPLGRTGVSR